MLLEGDMVSHGIAWANEVELGEDINSHGIQWDYEDNVFHLEGDSMHSMTTNDGIFYAKYDKFIPDWKPMKNMTWNH